MNIRSKLKSQFMVAGSIIIGFLGHSYWSNFLSYREYKSKEKVQQLLDERLDSMINQLEQINAKIIEHSKQLNTFSLSNNINESVLTSVKYKLETGNKDIDEGNRLLENINDKVLNKDEILSLAKENFSKGLTNLDEASKKLSELLNIDKDKLFSNLSSLYEYLDSLSLLEESSLFNILVLLVISLIIVNIYSSLFGNIVINYFKLEEKYPRINKFFKLRIQFQKYYLIFNLILFVIIFLFAIFINLLVFI